MNNICLKHNFYLKNKPNLILFFSNKCCKIIHLALAIPNPDNNFKLKSIHKNTSKRQTNNNNRSKNKNLNKEYYNYLCIIE